MNDVDQRLEEIEQGASGPRTAAMFDFDGTVIRGYSVEAFLRRRLRALPVDPHLLAGVVLSRLRTDWSETDVSKFVRTVAKALAGMPEQTAEKIAGQVLERDIAARLFPDAWRLILAHRRKGHLVALVSAATRFQVAPMAAELGVDHVLCTKLVTRNGVLTGTVDGEVVTGWAKEEALRKFAARHDVDLAASYAYADDAADVPFLDAVGHPCAVNPQPRLHQVAKERQWSICRFRVASGPGLPGLARTVSAYGATGAAMASALAVGMGVNRDRRQAVDLAQGTVADLALALTGVTVTVRGEHHLWARRPAVFLFNHRSSLDLLVVLKVLRRHLTSLAKKELKWFPGFGQFLWLSDAVFIDRSGPGTAGKVITEAVERLQRGVSLAIAPEGSRSLTPRLGRFHRGPFVIAMAAGVPVIPLVIRDTGTLLPKGAHVPRRGHVEVVVGAPVETTGWQQDGLERGAARVRDFYLEVLGQQPAPCPIPRETGSGQARDLDTPTS
ncbi:hypothetical protein BS329_16980 [Amycolatopsis coloradensis]|uniref:Phospholipid/glycerol acyltransferase domain-containing protein n=1 Tax=Amycolatopsis coloradensis TaxID=76021 RepID=A0A1R0KTV6_9PSEU|nr:HAD-IB family hydrolase [Amycolatopsis coloradensis]OLZ51474.1 hypothetical protein BS329_16980 [Amycolatopsis coloradensis]